MPSSRGARSIATRNRILDAAEQLFAEHGFDGVSLRTLAASAGVQLALLHYHFGTKLDLYRAVWMRRSAMVELARAPQTAISGKDRSLEEKIRALVKHFLDPWVRMQRTPELRPFLRIVAQEISDPKHLARGVVEEVLAPQAALFQKPMEQLLPSLPHLQGTIGLRIMIGAAQALFLDKETTVRMSGERSSQAAFDRAAAAMVEFLVAGWMAIGAHAAAFSRAADGGT